MMRKRLQTVTGSIKASTNCWKSLFWSFIHSQMPSNGELYLGAPYGPQLGLYTLSAQATGIATKMSVKARQNMKKVLLRFCVKRLSGGRQNLRTCSNGKAGHATQSVE
eukprot:TRINITY_DN6580_c0_g1_i4.p3 TRINITY_DN6580_c0_g1~~TRINITY_DN6580_c0_g1_i4.p3  ORF type:complete len:108 (-),score=5.35 TRINITY_DN6580_c0_g1_i4:1823-2146(-)